jgi:hypothetical protein
LLALSAAKRCCSDVLGLVVTSVTRMHLFMPNKSRFIYWIYLADINTYMKKKADLLTNKQYALLCQQKEDTLETNFWLKQHGLNPASFVHMDVKLLQAQKTAKWLLTNATKLLTAQQIQTLKDFMQRMSTKSTRNKLKTQAAFPILNINNKINRQLFKQHKQHTQA